ncbi:hypothetical protein PsorP6_011453 [Peronosclerospora sorghi]|uniref:Uncharacterized protein n=1 Tax=Peronosclerospora sorghi TaxID=230839 RepID=A0ACC0WIC5_9STRA|nr:hypothetical protein PsorP6_011453 [Peronosclerospora sorghi]
MKQTIPGCSSSNIKGFNPAYDYYFFHDMATGLTIRQSHLQLDPHSQHLCAVAFNATIFDTYM